MESKPLTMDFHETQIKSPLQKKSGIINMSILNDDTKKAFG